MNSFFQNLQHAAARHFALLLFFAVSMVFVGLSRDVAIGTIMTIAAVESAALWLCYLVFYVVSPVNFLTVLTESLNDDDFSSFAPAIIVAAVFVSVHVLCGMVVFGVYYTRYAPMP